MIIIRVFINNPEEMKVSFVLKWMRENKLLIMQTLSFISGKIILGVVELPQYQKDQNYLPELIISAIFYASSLVLKLISIPQLILKEVVLINLRSFLLWIVAILIIIFSFSLSHALSWSSSQIIFLMAILFFQTAVLILFSNWRYTSKIQFVIYQLILSINIIGLGVKTVIFIETEKDSPNKDIVLLNLTTQIAFSILIMDSIERAYKRYLESKKTIATRQIQQELTMNT